MAQRDSRDSLTHNPANGNPFSLASPKGSYKPIFVVKYSVSLFLPPSVKMRTDFHEALWSYLDSIVSASIKIPAARVAQEPPKAVFHVQLAQGAGNGFWGQS